MRNSCAMAQTFHCWYWVWECLSPFCEKITVESRTLMARMVRATYAKLTADMITIIDIISQYELRNCMGSFIETGVTSWSFHSQCNLINNKLSGAVGNKCILLIFRLRRKLLFWLCLSNHLWHRRLRILFCTKQLIHYLIHLLFVIMMFFVGI